MKLVKINQKQAGGSSACTDITRKGLRAQDDIVTVTDEAAISFCREQEGLCTARFTADLVLDELPDLTPGEKLRLGSSQLLLTARRKGCHPGCGLDPALCRINGRLLFFKVIGPGRTCVGDTALVDK